MSESTTDLSTATTAELIEELKSRSSAFCIGIDPLADRGCFTVCRSGSKLGVLGLITALRLDAEYDIQNDPRDKGQSDAS